MVCHISGLLEQLHVCAGAKQVEGGLMLHIEWADEFEVWLDNSILKARQHCKDELINFYESKIRKVPKAKSKK